MKHVSQLKEGDKIRDPELPDLVTVIEVVEEGEYWIVYGETDTDPEVSLIYPSDHHVSAVF